MIVIAATDQIARRCALRHQITEAISAIAVNTAAALAE
jgi:hypothetical protein